MNKKLTLVFSLITFSSVNFSQTTTEEKEDTLLTNTPVFVTTLEDGENSSGSAGNISGLLQSSRDVFAATAGFNFSPARFKIRGYQSDKTMILLNGIPMNDLETGYGTWYKWGGLNDITRYSETKNWLTDNPYHFGGIGGYSNINAKATGVRKGSRLSYAATNRAYRNRLMYTYGTGMQANGWAFAFSLSSRFAKEGYVDGTYYEAYGYFLAAEKKINANHSLNLSILGAPTKRGKSSISTLETYELSGDNFYNSYWGYQTQEDGTKVKRNSRNTDSHMPIIALSHDWKINTNSSLKTSLSSSFGKYGQTALNWYDAKDPRPDYYKYLPSYYESINDDVNAQRMFMNWQNEESRQIQWDALYFANSKNLYTLKDENGTVLAEGLRSKYIVETRWNNLLSGGISSVYNYEKDNLSIHTGVFGQAQRNHYYNTIDDLLGGDFWVDVNRFAEQDFIDPNAAQSDLQNPNRIVKEGDVYANNYYIYNINATAFGQLNYTTKKIDYYAALELSNEHFYREGLFQTGLFPDNSLGKSESKNFVNYAVKGGATYKLSGRQYITANAAYLTEAPTSRSAFISPRTRNVMVDDLKNETIYTGDLNYILRYPKLKLRFTYYYTERKDAIWSRSFYHDEYNSFINYVMEDVDYFHQGIEFGVDGTIFGGLTGNAVVAVGQHLYNSRPTASIYVDNSAEQLAKDKTIYLQNYKIGGMPQSAASFGLKYSGKKYWFAGVNFNYFADIYLDPNPDRRTEESIAGFVESDPQYLETIEQTKLENGYSLNLFAGKSFKINNYFLNINVNVSNLTNNTSFITGGYEQLRFDTQNINKFPPKLGYLYGLNYFIMATLRF
ncbi:TonB-dependent receptor [Crocinitomix algicola]|uniref:TonB-dependent receptor n=1 Tax=Crocinitomix algicola TaxID=1740263 RepID=UPI0008720672|nr:TonB-dependent receptor [Crocinitomix algicola]